MKPHRARLGVLTALVSTLAVLAPSARVVPAGGRRAGFWRSYASAAAGSAATGMIRTRFLSRVSCSKRTFPSILAKIV